MKSNFFVALFVLSICKFVNFDISVGLGAFVIGLSQISSFFSFQRNGVITYVITDTVKNILSYLNSLELYVRC